MSSNTKTSVLGRDKTKHISCGFEGHEADCPDNCEKCAIYIKTCGDELLAEGKVDLAIKQYKRALFAEPKFAEAWVNLGNAFGMKSEYNNALTAFDKAIAIDPVYGNAMFGKAITLRNLGKNEAAMSLANAILLLYDNANVRKFKEGLAATGTLDPTSIFTLDQAIEELTDIAYEILHKNDLLGPSGSVVTEKAICQKEDFAAQVYRFCKKRYASSGKKKLNSESILKAFYGSLCTTLFYYSEPNDLAGIDTFKYLMEHVDIEKVEDVAEKMLNIRGDKARCDELWDTIYEYVKVSLEIFEKITPTSDVESAVIDATESAYMMGMMYAMKQYATKKQKEDRANLDAALDKLAASSADYDYTPEERSAMCYSISLPEDVQIVVSCPKCGCHKKITVWAGEEDLLSKYKRVAEDFSKLGYPASVACYCNECANMLYPSHSSYSINNIVFSIEVEPKRIVKSFPSSHCFRDFEYRVALAFLRGADTIEKLAKATSTELPAETYLEHINNVLGKGRRFR